MVVMYIPEIVTDRQLEWFELHKFDYFNYQLIGAFSVANGSESKQISGLEEINKEMIDFNEIYSCFLNNIKYNTRFSF